MFDYTRSILDKIVNDIKKTARAFMIFTQAATIAYLIYSLIAPVGKLWVNIPLLALSVIYFIIYIALTSEKWDDTKAETTKKRKTLAKARNIFARSKLVVNFFPMVGVVYGLASASTHATPISTILSLLPVLGWVLQFIFEILRMLIDKYKALLGYAVRKDTEGIVKAYNAVSKFMGKPPMETAAIPEKAQEILDLEKEKFQKKQEIKRSAKAAARKEQILQYKEQKSQERAAKKTLRLELKQNKKLQKKNKKVKKEDELSTNATKDENSKLERD